MKKNYFLLLGLFLFSGVNAQVINFPDANFKNALMQTTPGSLDYAHDLAGNPLKIDANGNGQIEVSEALQVSTLYLEFNSITSLVGISNFSNLQWISCGYNSLSTIDVSSLSNLTFLTCTNNHLTSINVTGMINLQRLNIGDNNFTSFNLTGLTGLQELHCSYNLLSSLDISYLPNLQLLDCSHNQISTLITGTNLYDLNCSYNQLTSFNFNNLINLGKLNCSTNIFDTLDVTNLTALQEFYFSYNPVNSVFMKNGKDEILYFINTPDLKYICADDSQIISVEDMVTSNGYTNCAVNSYCSFTPGGTSHTIQGNNRYDQNNNGCDITDINFPSLKFNLTDGTITGNVICNQTGAYSIPVIAGTHTINPILENPTYFNVSPTSTTVTFPAQASPFTQDFCVTANGVHPDLEIVLLPTNRPRAGFDATYKIIYKNKGTTTQSGTVNLTFEDAVLDFVLANPVTTTQATNNLSWDYTNLLPFETREIILTLNINSPTDTPPVNGGDIIVFATSITSPDTDDTPNDNTIAFHQTVFNAYDPNDKTCLEGTTITPAMVGEYMHYVIRFENTGTNNAQNIVVKDIIDTAKFDINTLIPIKGSHEFVTNITSGNKVEFIFENINLPFDDANNDGFVAFKIKTKSSLVVGDTFTNSANIYFDYNFPIVTNIASTTVQTLGTSDFEFAKYFTVYPNPVSNTLNLSTKSGISVNAIAIYNTLGQLVIAIPNAQSVSNIDVSSLKTGNYFIKMTTDKGTANTKFIKN